MPIEELSLLSCEELDAKICGSPNITFEQLKTVINCSLEGDQARYFWEVLEHDFTCADRSLFLRFACGFRRLPPDASTFRLRISVTFVHVCHVFTSLMLRA